MTGKIVDIQNDGVWNKWNKFRVTMATGEQFQFKSVGEFNQKIGDEIQFTKKNMIYDGYFAAELDKGQQNFYQNQPQNQNYQEKPKVAYNAPKGDDKQISIIRQSMLKASVDYWSGSGVSTEQVINTAREFVNFVNQG